MNLLLTWIARVKHHDAVWLPQEFPLSSSGALLTGVQAPAPDETNFDH